MNMATYKRLELDVKSGGEVPIIKYNDISKTYFMLNGHLNDVNLIK